MAMNEAFKNLNIINRRIEDEKQFSEWVAAKPERVQKYGNALADVKSGIEGRANLQYTIRYFQEALSSIELTSAATRFGAKADDKENSQSVAITEFYKDYNLATDIKVAKAMMKLFKEKVPASNLPDFYKTIDSLYHGNIDLFVDDMYSKSVFSSAEKLKLAQSGDNSVLTTDLAYVTGKSINDALSRFNKDIEPFITTYTKGQKQYIAGILEMKDGEAMYPDANFTMRLTYGKVLNYSPKDGVIYDYITTLDGVMQKEDPNNWEFVVPEKLKELHKNKDFGQYALKDGRMPLAFLTNNDITGGNSGSPVMNRKGELIGTAFDGNWESMSSDILFEPTLQRCINVDIRYTLFIMDKFGGAGYLLNEMKFAK